MRPTPGSGRGGRGCASTKGISWTVVREVRSASAVCAGSPGLALGGGSGCGALLGLGVWECGKALQPQLCVLLTPLLMRVSRCGHAEFPVIKEPGTAWGTGTHFTDEALVV